MMFLINSVEHALYSATGILQVYIGETEKIPNAQILVWFSLIHYSAFFGSEGHVALDRNPGPGDNTLLLRMIPGDLSSAFPHRQF